MKSVCHRVVGSVSVTNARMIVFLLNSRSVSISEAAWHCGMDTRKRPNGLQMDQTKLDRSESSRLSYAAESLWRTGSTRVNA